MNTPIGTSNCIAKSGCELLIGCRPQLFYEYKNRTNEVSRRWKKIYNLEARVAILSQ